MSLPSNESSGLGSLAQSARTKEFKQARPILLFIGVATILLNGWFFFAARDMVKAEISKEIQKLQGQGLQIDQGKVQQLEDSSVFIAQLLIAGSVMLGVIFVIFGFLVNKYTVPITIMSLVLYVGAAIVFGFLDPTTLLQGIIIKVFIVGALIKAMQAAIAYQKELDSAADVEHA